VTSDDDRAVLDALYDGSLVFGPVPTPADAAALLAGLPDDGADVLVPVTVRLPYPTYERLHAEAASAGVTVEALIQARLDGDASPM
jgi:hypothetical protein